VAGRGDPDRDGALRDYRALVEATAPPPENSGALFYGAIWRPLEPPLAGVKRVYLSPDGIFNSISWMTVPSPGGKLLGERYEIQLLLSTRDLTRRPLTGNGRSAVLVGAPNFELDAEGQRAAARSASDRLVRSPQANPSAAKALRAGAALEPLPGTERELQAIRSELEQHGWQTTVHSGSDAIEENIKSVRSPRLLHVATHGFFAPDPPRVAARLPEIAPTVTDEPMLRSMLYFAGANRALRGEAPATGSDDGVLTAYEASDLMLHGTELVVLSACETGLGVNRNAEGVFGLRRALQEAGAEAVLMTLWKVPDRDTQELITAFYRAWLSGMTKQAALRKAQLEMRERVRSRREGNDVPYYWGAFVLVGR
jgi:CHAT domain-containing protein